MAAIHNQRAEHPDPFMPAEGRILSRSRHGTILPDCLQQCNGTLAGFVCDYGTDVSDDTPNLLSTMPEVNIMETLPLRYVSKNPNCVHAASHQFCCGILAMIRIASRIDMR